MLIRVKADENAPVSFYHAGVGRFENELKSVTVAADENGIAEVRFAASPGTKGLNTILAASPLHSQQFEICGRCRPAPIAFINENKTSEKPLRRNYKKWGNDSFRLPSIKYSDFKS